MTIKRILSNTLILKRLLNKLRLLIFDNFNLSEEQLIKKFVLYYFQVLKPNIIMIKHKSKQNEKCR